jgi:hypothetical protein
MYTLTDPDMGKSVTFTDSEFFDQHFKLIWLGTITNYRHDWISFAFRRGDEENYDDYDALTVDAVLQNMLYGEIVYG